MKHEGSSVVIALVLAETEFDLCPPEECRWEFPFWQITTCPRHWSSRSLATLSLTSSVLDEERQPIDKEVFTRMLSLLRNQVANRAPQRCADQNECGAARGCSA